MKPIKPKAGTLAAHCLQLLRTRPSLTSPSFQEATGSWRLAAVIFDLRGLGWPILAATIPSGTSKRGIARYFLQIVDDVHEK